MTKTKREKKDLWFSENLCLENRSRIPPKDFESVKELQLEAGSREGCEVLERHERR